MSLDPRAVLARPDLAARDLEAIVAADRYDDRRRYVCRTPAAALRRAPSSDAEQLDQLLFGEGFDVLEVQDGFAWGQARRDGYVGFVEAGALKPADSVANMKVSALRTYAFAQPSIKSRAIGPYSLGSLLTVEAREGRFAKAADGGWFVEDHLAPIGVFEADPAAVALRYLGTPYLWGGRESLGLDCSGLTLQALGACGVALPRDTDQQAQGGAAVAESDLARGDLVFWKGHVAMMLDGEAIVHANAHHMATAIEPLSVTRARYVAAGVGEPTAFRRY
ncbi:NlpC/P60 family protein [Phenylobacterium sp.]|uniref:C40 family peptidase n=1 Tax=Phenylobacterium sp. TaxID=1871053 RepID=UPI00289D096D|nr:NlpC/P60 family protein [Phenylobacterium sp.]